MARKLPAWMLVKDALPMVLTGPGFRLLFRDGYSRLLLRDGSFFLLRD